MDHWWRIQTLNLLRAFGWLVVWISFSRNNLASAQLPAREDKPTTFAVPADDFASNLARRLADVESQLRARDAKEQQASEVAAKKFSVRPFGRIQIHAGTFNQDAANKATVGDAGNGLIIRRARLGVEGDGFDSFLYRFDVDFVTADSGTEERPTIFDAYLDTQHLPVIGNLRVGHFREPFSLERLDSSSDLPFLERSLPVDALTPKRNLGVMAFDWNECETMTWAFGLFHEDTNEFGESLRDHTGIAATGRVTWLPWISEDNRELLHLGASYSFRRTSEAIQSFDQSPEFALREGPLSTPDFVDTGDLKVHGYHIAGCEAVVMLGALSLQGEYIFLAGTHDGGQGLFLHGGYVEATYWLTGERQNYNRRLGIHGAVVPRCPFRGDGCEWDSCSWGAWEATARVSWLDLDHGSVDGGKLTDLTFGLNWYCATRCRVMFNYIHAFLDRDSVQSNADIFAARYQFTF